LLPEEVEVQALPKEGYALAEEHDILVGVEIVINEELRKEGLARDIVRRIQNERKERAFDIDDHIETYFVSGAMLTDVFNTHGDYIASETLSTSIQKDELPTETSSQGAIPVEEYTEYEIDGESLRLRLIRKKKNPKHTHDES
jgi:isoleucyl-tRNA synthetase